MRSATGISDHGEVRIQCNLFKSGVILLTIDQTWNRKSVWFIRTFKSLV